MFHLSNLLSRNASIRQFQYIHTYLLLHVINFFSLLFFRSTTMVFLKVTKSRKNLPKLIITYFRDLQTFRTNFNPEYCTIFLNSMAFSSIILLGNFKKKKFLLRRPKIFSKFPLCQVQKLKSQLYTVLTPSQPMVDIFSTRFQRQFL